MSGELIGELILWLIVAVVVIAIIYWVMQWLYRRSTKETAFVRTGFLGECEAAPSSGRSSTTSRPSP